MVEGEEDGRRRRGRPTLRCRDSVIHERSEVNSHERSEVNSHERSEVNSHEWKRITEDRDGLRQLIERAEPTK